ncbi:MAG: protein arginine kinase [Bacillota bacterium]|nr:protein arginine kinase [Bacillota bacterium]
MQNWINNKDDSDNIVLSSRIRLARSLREIPFPNRLSDEQGLQVVKSVEDAFYTNEETKNKFSSKYLWLSSESENSSFLEKHLISSNLINNHKKAAFILDKDETISIMINEEDHVRLQCINAGFNLDETYSIANNIDDVLESNLEFAFDERFGYLTACPTNLGTGLRASVMIHLPALSMNNQMSQVLNALTQVGMTIRGLYGEGSTALSNLYQISNQITLGISELDILSNLQAVVSQVINQENLSRAQLMKNYKYELQDKIYRSLGILKTAVILPYKECLKLLSNVRMGVEMGIIKEIDKSILNSLIVNSKSIAIEKYYENNMSDKHIDVKRAEFVREKLK